MVETCDARTAALFPRDASTAHFDCADSCFETDREDGPRGKGPSKERRPEPVVGMGLLLDAGCVPMGMRRSRATRARSPSLGTWWAT